MSIYLGGVEKATCDFANAMVERGHQVTLLYIDKVEGEPYFQLDGRVHQQNILFAHGRQVVSNKLPSYLRVWREVVRCFSQAEARAINVKCKGCVYGPLLNRYIEQAHADIIVSCSIPSTTYIVNYTDCHLPIVQMIHDDPPTQWHTFSKVEMKAAGQCKAMQTLLEYTIPTIRRYFPIIPLHVIGLPVFQAARLAHPGVFKDEYIISCVGNVCDRKNQKFLVEAFAELALSYPEWRLEFWGSCDSAYGKMISHLIHSKNLGNQVILKGKTACVDQVYEHSDIFAIPSKIESFSLSLSEAMSAGLPAVGVKTCNGVNSLIQDGETGYLTDPDVHSYRDALKNLMDDANLRKNMGEAGRLYVQKYRPEKIWEQWERVLRESMRS